MRLPPIVPLLAIPLLTALATVSVSASPAETEPRHFRSFSCPLAGCKVSCTAGAAPAVDFVAKQLTLEVLPNRVALFTADNGMSGRRTHLVDLSDRNCDVQE